MRTFLVWFGVTAAALASAAEVRTWKTASGTSAVEAEMVGYSQDEGTVELRKANGKTVKVPLDKLSEADRQYVKEQADKRAPPDKKTPAGTVDATSDKTAPADTEKASAGKLRTWTNADGTRTIEAEFVSFKQGKVELRKADGTVFSATLEKLSDVDQQYVKNRSRPSSKVKPKNKAEDGETPEETAEDAPAVGGPLVCNLKLKHLASPRQALTGRSRIVSDAVYRACNPHRFYMRTGVQNIEGQAFRRLVKQEPKYESSDPLRGVVRLGDDEYAFAVDVSTGKADTDKATDKTADKSKSKPKSKPKPKSKTAPALPPRGPGNLQGPKETYNRLYFDLNHNGDLTDDEPIEGEVMPGGAGQSIFPRIDVTVKAGGQQMEYAASLSVYAYGTESNKSVTATLTPGVYREGELSLRGKRRKIALLDYNTNGRFNDLTKIQSGAGGSEVDTVQGDVLLIDPDSSAPDSLNYDVMASRSQQNVAKLVNLDGRLYAMKISETADKLTLSPCAVPVGYVTNPNDGFRALVYGDQGVMKITGDHTSKVPLPEGQWKVAMYTIDRTGLRDPSPRSTAKSKKPARPGTPAAPAAPAGPMGARQGPTLVSARASSAYKPVEVRKGETVELPFGPPYKPVVKGFPAGADGKARLMMSLVGIAGEVCNNLLINGNRGESPQFTIENPGGDVVERGKFEYG